MVVYISPTLNGLLTIATRSHLSPDSGDSSPGKGIRTMDYSKIRIISLAMISLLFAGVLYFTISKPFFSLENLGRQLSNMTSMNYIHKDDLEIALDRASTKTKIVIIAVLNKAQVNSTDGDKAMLDLFVDGFWLGENTRTLLHHLILVPVDQTAFDRCNFLRLHCYRLQTDGVSVWRRTLFLGDVLKRGYSFIFTDIDIMWLRNPFEQLSQDESEDLKISTDTFNGDPWSEKNRINIGFYFIRSNKKTISLFDRWYAMKDYSIGLKEKDFLDNMMHDGVFRKLGLKVRFLDTLFFSGFCQDSRDFRAVKTVHANCCRSISAKLTDLTTILHDWKRFKTYIANETSSVQWSKHVACINSWKAH